MLKDDTNTADLILDHNTTQTCYWRSADDTSVQGGPIDVIQKVKRDTENWQGVLTPDNYTLNGVTNTYTIDYSNSNARIITAQEIAELTENYWFDEKKTKYAEKFSFDNNGVDFNTILRGDNSVSTWGWAYDRVC